MQTGWSPKMNSLWVGACRQVTAILMGQLPGHFACGDEGGENLVVGGCSYLELSILKL